MVQRDAVSRIFNTLGRPQPRLTAGGEIPLLGWGYVGIVNFLVDPSSLLGAPVTGQSEAVLGIFNTLGRPLLRTAKVSYEH